jgi:hypothetical protein
MFPHPYLCPRATRAKRLITPILLGSHPQRIGGRSLGIDEELLLEASDRFVWLPI